MFIEDSVYKMIVENVIIEAVDLMVLNAKSELLLGLRNNEPLKGVYYMPGGRRYKNELMIDSLKRKAYEELGLKIDENKISFLGIYDDIYDNSVFGSVPSHYSSITYVYLLSEEEELSIVADSQHQDFRFFSLDDPLICSAVQLRILDMEKKHLI